MRTLSYITPLLVAAVASMASPAAQADLGLSIHARSDTATPGAQVPLTITVTNPGLSTLTNVQVSVLIPPGLANFRETITEASGNLSCSGGPVSSAICESGEALVWVVGTLDPGDGVPLVVSPMIDSGTGAPLDGTNITFAATASAVDETDVGASTSVVVRDVAPVMLSLDARAAPVISGAREDYVLTFSNAGSGTVVADASVVLELPVDTTFIEASEGGSLVGDTVVWTLGDLAPGAYGRLQATLSGVASAGTLRSASAVLLGGEVVVAGANDTTHVGNSEALTLATEFSRDIVRPGQTMAGFVTVTNPGATTKQNVQVSVLVPDSVNNFNESITEATANVSCSGGDVSSAICEPAERLVYQLGDLTPGDGVTVALPPQVADATGDSTLLPLVAWARDNGNGDARSASVLVVDSTPNLAVDARTQQSVARAGDALDYMLTYSNPSDTAVTSTVLTVPVPPGTSFARIENGGSVIGDVATWSLGTLAPGQAGAVTLSVDVDPALDDGELVRLTAAIAGDGDALAWSQRATRVETGEALALSLVLSQTVAGADETVGAALTVTNTGAAALSLVRVTAVLPDAMQTFNESKARPVANLSCGGGPVSSATCERGERLVWIVNSLAAGGSATIALPPIVAESIADGELLLFDSWASDDDAGFARAMRSAVVGDGGALSTSLTASASPVEPGDPITLTVRYVSDVVAPDAQLVLPVPDGTTPGQIRDGGNLVGDAVVWSLGSLNPGQSGAVSATFDVDGDAITGDVIAGRVFLGDASGERGWARSATRVDEVAAMSIDVRVVPDAARPGETSLTVLTLSNRTATALNNVALIAVVPDGVANFNEGLLAATTTLSCGGGPTSSSLCEQGEQMIWQFPSVPAGGGTSVVIPPIVAEGAAAGTQANTLAWVTADNTPTASASVYTVNDAGAPLELDIAPRTNPVAAGDNLVYDLVYGQVQTGAGAATLQFTLPARTTFVAASAGGVQNGDEVSWQVSGLDKGEGGRVSVTVATDVGLGDGALLVAQAALTSGAFPDAQARARSVVRTESAAGLKVDGGFLGEPLRPGRADAVTFTVANATTETADFVRLRVTVADEIDTFSEGDTSATGTLSCSGGPISSSSCEQAESLVFDLGSLAAGEERTVTIPITTSVESTAGPNGQVTRYHAVATDAVGRSAERRIATVIGDGDAFADPFDNCLFTPNDDQLDGDNDGYGNACDADLNNDCIVNVVDLGIFRNVFFTPDPAADLNGDGIVNVVDLGLLRALFFSVPGPAIGGPCE